MTLTITQPIYLRIVMFYFRTVTVLATEDTSDMEDTLYFDDTDDSAVPDPTTGDADGRLRPYRVTKLPDPRTETTPHVTLRGNK